MTEGTGVIVSGPVSSITKHAASQAACQAECHGEGQLQGAVLTH